MLLLKQQSTKKQSTPRRRSARVSPRARLPFLAGWPIALVVSLATTFAVAQEGDDEETEEQSQAADAEGPVETVVVTGSRVARQPSELSRNVIVLDAEAIRATGEFTLAPVLQQLPQNTNPTNATYGSQLNGVKNATGAATVNLRGLGSESTLILVDGRRVGHSGILGGVTDISTIPLSMVERIEVLLDGASAVYGSDAVGGVVNIITRKDYQGVEVGVDYVRPHKTGFDETRVSIAGGLSWDGGRAKAGFEQYRDTGLDSSLRDSIILSNRLLTTRQKNTAPGPQIRVWTWFFDESCNEGTAILWGLDGRLLTNAEHQELPDADKARATCHNDLTLPLGFRHTDDLNTIDAFGEQNWGEEAEVGYSLTPEQTNTAFHVGVDQNLTDNTILHASLRLGTKESSSENGLNGRSGFLHANSPFNPFGKGVSLTGLAVDQPPNSFESEQNDLFVDLGIEGGIGSWAWVAEYGVARQEGDTKRLNVRDPAYGMGVNSDGVSEAVIGTQRGGSAEDCEALMMALGGTRFRHSTFFGGQCTVYGAPPDPIDPFGDISPWIIPDVNAGYQNQQTRFEALVRGSVLDLPGGALSLVFGYDYREDVLDSFSEFNTFVYIGSNSATGSGPFDTYIARDSHAMYMEGVLPLVGADNASGLAQTLNLTFSARHDSYSNAEVEYARSDTGEGGTLDAADPGSKTTWSIGLVYQPADSLRLKTDVSTSYVAPQLNQLLSRVRSNPNAALWHFVPGGGGAISSRPPGNVIEYTGGNDKLTPENAETTSVSLEFTPSFLPGAYIKAGWSDTEFLDRIVKLSVPIVDLDELPSNVTYDEAENTYVVDRRWINASAVNRDGVDLELGYTWRAGDSEFEFTLRRAYNNGYDVVQDATSGVTHDIVWVRDDTGPEDTTLAPVPKHQTNMQFTWSRAALFASLDVHTADETMIKNATNREYLTEPAVNIDLVVSYDLERGTFTGSLPWTTGMAATLTINNLGDSFAETTNINPETNQRQRYSLNPVYEWTQGRSYRLSLHKSF